MAQETLKITITADNQQAVKNIQETVTATNNLGNAFKTLPNTSNQATNALTNLSRVAQDAPYGFIGIANNLNPLLESFQRLQKESGSTSSALKSMAQGLIGPAGIGLALGVVSSLFVTFGSQIADFILETTAAEKAQSKLNDSIAKGAGDVALETTRLETLVGIVTNVTKSTQERDRALKAIQNSYKGNLELQKIDINDGNALTLVIDNITSALKRKALAQSFATLIAEEEVKKARLQLESLKEMRDKVSGLTASWEFIKSAIANAGSAMGAAEYNVSITNKALSKHSEELNGTNANLGILNEKYKNVIGEQIQFNDSTTLSTSSIKNQATEVSNASRELAAYIANYKELTKPTRELKRSATISKEPIQGLTPPDKLTQKTPAEEIRQATLAEQKLNDQLELTASITGILSSGFNNVFEAVASGQDFGDALAETFKNIIMQIIEMIAKALILRAVLAAITGGSSEVAYQAGSVASGVNGAAQLGTFVLKGADLVLATQRANNNLNIRRGQ